MRALYVFLMQEQEGEQAALGNAAPPRATAGSFVLSCLCSILSFLCSMLTHGLTHAARGKPLAAACDVCLCGRGLRGEGAPGWRQRRYRVSPRRRKASRSSRAQTITSTRSIALRGPPDRNVRSKHMITHWGTIRIYYQASQSSDTT